MAKAKFERTKPHANIGAIGHVDHGKTTLTATITKVLHDKYPDLNEYTPFDQVDDAPERRDRGITINISHAECQTDKRHYAHVDAPGHADYVKNVITGAAQMNGVALMITATDGPMTQTREHVLLARQVDVPTILIALNETDMVNDEEMLELAGEKCRGLLGSQDFDRDTPIIQISALKILEGDPEWIAKVEELMDVMDSCIPTPKRDMDEPFLVPIEDAFTITDRGAVVTSHVEHDRLPINSGVEILGIHEPQRTTITGIEMFHRSIDEAQTDGNCGLLLHDTKCDEVRHGQVVAVPSPITSHTDFEGQIYILKKEEGGRHNPFFPSYRPQFYSRAADVTGIITLPEGTDIVIPGDITEISVQLIQSIAMEPDPGFAIREGGRIVGSGRITKIIK